MTEHPDAIDKPLSELDEEYQEVFHESTKELEQTAEGFNKILEVIEKVKNEEITLLEGQEKMDQIVEEYELPKIR